MATKKIQIEFDLNTNEVKLAGEATLSLAQQVKILQRELQKTPEGTKEFELLRRKLNDTRDNFDRVNAKSRELFGTLSLIPGPVGEIAGKLNGAISLFKTFSGFSFKDLKNQFGGLIDDIKGIFISLGSLGEKTQEVSNETGNLTTKLQENNQAAIAAGSQLQNNIKLAENEVEVAKRNLKVASEKLLSEEIYQDLLKLRLQELEDIENTQRNLTQEELKEQRTIQKELNTSQGYYKRYAAEVVNADMDLKAAEKTVKSYTVAQRAQNAAVVVGTNALRIFRGVLLSIGIGFLIVGITTLISKIGDWITSTKEADRVNQKLGETIDSLNRILDANISRIDEEIEKNTIRARIAGKTEKEINDITIKGIDDRIKAFKKGMEDMQFLMANTEADARLTEEQRNERLKQLEDDYLETGKKILDLEKQRRIQEVKGEEILFEEKKKQTQKNKELREKNAQEEIERRKAELDAQIQLEIDSATTRKDVLEKLLQERLKLEKLSGNRLLLAQQQNNQKVQEALQDDFEKRRQRKIDDYQALIEIEENQADVDTERLIKLLEKRRDLELQEIKNGEKLTGEEKKAIIAKYESEFRQLRQNAREKQLVEDIQAAEGDFEKQIQLYRQFADEVINSKNYTAAEQLRIQQETNEKIQQLEQQRFDNEKTKLELKLQDDKLTYTQYFDELDLLYQQEIQRTEEQYKKKEIIEAEYNKRIKELTDARNNIRQQELEAQIATFQAIGQGLGAISQMVGEQTKQGKAFAVAASLINTYAAIAGQLKAFAGVPIPGYAIAQAIATGLVGFAQVRKILSTQIPGSSSSSTSQGTMGGGIINVNQRRAQGGMIFGPGGETSDNIPAMLSNGEFVMNARSTRVFRPLLESMNSAANLPQFAVGGLVSSGGPTPPKSQNETLADAISSAFGSTPIRTYVTATDVSTQQQFDRIIKSRSLI